MPASSYGMHAMSRLSVLAVRGCECAIPACIRSSHGMLGQYVQNSSARFPFCKGSTCFVGRRGSSDLLGDVLAGTSCTRAGVVHGGVEADLMRQACSTVWWACTRPVLPSVGSVNVVRAVGCGCEAHRRCNERVPALIGGVQTAAHLYGTGTPVSAA